MNVQICTYERFIFIMNCCDIEHRLDTRISGYLHTSHHFSCAMNLNQSVLVMKNGNFGAQAMKNIVFIVFSSVLISQSAAQNSKPLSSVASP